MIRGVIALQCLWFAVVVAVGVRSHAHRHSLTVMEGSASMVLGDVLYTYVLFAAVLAAAFGLMRRRSWGWTAAVFVNVSIVGIPPLVLWLFVHWWYPEFRGLLDAPAVSLTSLAVAAPLMMPRVRRGFS